MLAQAVSATLAARVDYAFDYDVNTSKLSWRTHYEPNGSPRLRLLEPRRSALDGDERRAFDNLAERLEGVSWCAGESMGQIANARLVREDNVSAVYVFQPTRESLGGQQARRYADRLRGEFTLLKGDPDVSHIHIFTPRAFSPVPLVNVESVDVAIACERAPNGRRYAAETVSEVRGSAFGRAFEERSVQRMRNLTRTP